MSRISKHAIALAATLTLAACGGGDSDESLQAQADAQADAQVKRARALAAQAINNDQLFQWAQLTYPSLFGSASPAVIANLAFEGKVFDVRDFRNGNYLGVANGRAYGYGAFTNYQLVDYGAVQDFATHVCSLVDCSGGTGGGGTGSLNECTDPAMSSLPTGARTTAVYVYEGLVTGEQTVDSVITGPATFKGQNAVLVTSTTKGTNTIDVGGFATTTTTTTVVKSYEQPSSNGLVKTLGVVSDVTTTVSLPAIPGVPTLPGTDTLSSIETVFNPPIENIEFTLALGGSLTKTSTSTTTTLSGTVIPPPTTVTTSQSYRFEAKETISVPAGSYNTCRYKVGTPGTADEGTLWLIVGKGVMAKSEGLTPQGVQTVSLKSGTYNGAPL